MKTSAIFSLDIRDFLKSLVVAALAPILVIIQRSADAGTFVGLYISGPTVSENWKHAAMAALAGMAAYLIKNYFTTAQTFK
jgi:hypothetical protein